MHIKSFKSVVKNYKGVLLDSFGVLRTHRGIIPEVQSAIDYIRKKHIALRVLTNDASRSPEQQAKLFSDQGLEGILPEEIITSGMMARNFIHYKVKKGRIAYLGTENSASNICDIGCDMVPVSQIDLDHIDDITAMVFLDDEGFDWNYDINTTVNLLRKKNILTVVANTDKLYPLAGNRVNVATGGLAHIVESIVNKEFIHFGKPDSQMFMHAFEELNQVGSFEKSDLLMVGDTLHTDILGGNKFGITTALVLSGNTREENAKLLIESTGVIPDYVCRSITI